MKLEAEKQQEVDTSKDKEIFFALINGQRVTEILETSRGKFICKFPKQKDLNSIELRIARMRQGLPAVSFDQNANFELMKVATLDELIIDGPDWYQAAKRKNDFFSWGDVPDTNFVSEVYVKVWTFRQELQEKFKQDKKEADPGELVQTGVPETMDDGLFSEVTSDA